jgi:hypothetical protein
MVGGMCPGGSARVYFIGRDPAEVVCGANAGHSANRFGVTSSDPNDFSIAVRKCKAGAIPRCNRPVVFGT